MTAGDYSANAGWEALTRLQNDVWKNYEDWFKIMNFHGLSGHQPECPVMIDDWLRELVKAREALKLLVEAKRLQDQHEREGAPEYTRKEYARYKDLKTRGWALAFELVPEAQ